MKNFAWNRLPIRRPCISVIAVMTVSISPASTAAFNSSSVRLPGISCSAIQMSAAQPGRAFGFNSKSGLITVRRTGLDHGLVILLEDLDDLCLGLGFRSHLVPEHGGGLFHLVPLIGRDGRELQLVAARPVLGLATPVPPLAIVM